MVATNRRDKSRNQAPEQAKEEIWFKPNRLFSREKSHERGNRALVIVF